MLKDQQRGLAQISCESATILNLIQFSCSIGSEWRGDNHVSETWSIYFPQAPTYCPGWQWFAVISIISEWKSVEKWKGGQGGTLWDNLDFQWCSQLCKEQYRGKVEAKLSKVVKVVKVVRRRVKVCQCRLGWVRRRGVKHVKERRLCAAEERRVCPSKDKLSLSVSVTRLLRGSVCLCLDTAVCEQRCHKRRDNLCFRARPLLRPGADQAMMMREFQSEL